MPTPQCCQYSKYFITLIFESYFGHDPDFFKSSKPFWVVRGAISDDPCNYKQRDREISFCPSCGKELPDIRLKQHPPEKVTVITDGGYYCDTCKERLMCCTCAKPDELWEIVPGTEKDK